MSDAFAPGRRRPKFGADLTDVEALPYAVVAVCMPLFFLQLAETVTQLGVDTPMGWRNVVRISVSLLCLGLGLTSFLSMKAGWKRGVVLTVVSSLLTFHVMNSYRGSYVWPGTFDLFDFSRWRWLTYPSLVVPISALAGMIVFRKPPSALPLWAGYAAAFSAVLACVVAWYLTAVKHAEGTSEFAPTRPLAYAFFGLVCLTVMAFLRMETE